MRRGIMATALLLAPLFESLPWAVLAAIVIASVLGLIDLDELRRYWAWRRADAILAVAALIGVATTDVLLGLLIAVLLSLLMLLLRASRPDVARLGRLPGDRELYADLERNPAAAAIPGIVVVRLDAPLYFFNASACRAAIVAQVDGEPATPHVVVLDLAATSDLDVTTTDMLGQLHDELAARGVRLVLAHAKGRVRESARPDGAPGAARERRRLLLRGPGGGSRGAAHGRAIRSDGGLTPAGPTRGAGPAPARAGHDGSRGR